VGNGEMGNGEVACHRFDLLGTDPIGTGPLGAVPVPSPMAVGAGTDSPVAETMAQTGGVPA